MVRVHIKGEDRTSQLSNWTLSHNERSKITELTCHFHSGKRFKFPLADCEITPTRHISGALLKKKGCSTFDAIASAIIYGEKYAVVYYEGSDKPYVMKADGLEIQTNSGLKEHDVFKYLLQVARERVNHACGVKRNIAENVQKQLEKSLPHPDTALFAYCSGQVKKREGAKDFIFPFGINESQLQAVESAFSSQLSIIEGPPGTGKTQTILNIVANILIQNKTVAILSNNNTAVSNVYEKLEAQGLGYAVAKLGSTENKKCFFSAIEEKPEQQHIFREDLNEISEKFMLVKKYLYAINEQALLKAEIDELTIELKYLREWQRTYSENVSFPTQRYRLSPGKTTDLMAYINYLSDRRIGLKNRIALLWDFRIFRVKSFDSLDKRLNLFSSLQIYYYEEKLREKNNALEKIEGLLRRYNFDALLGQLKSSSMNYLKAYLLDNIPDDLTFTIKGYRDDFSDFLRRFPVTGSSTHSIMNSVGKGALLDYIIIDEASQQDILPGVLGMACARNVIVVGDRKQLAHVSDNIYVPPPSEYYDCVKYSLLDSLVALFKDSVPLTLLKEHYRCHPKIIQFCNKQFYDNALIPITKDSGEVSLSLVITAKGNHTRRYSNLREIDSIGGLSWDEQSSRGFISPYNAQVNLSEKVLPEDYVKSTVHKFQGRECDEIVFSTVLDKKISSQDSKIISFVDNPNLINVAVSRARKKFTLVTGDGVFEGKGKYISSLIRYIRYYADDEHIYESPVISAFDLLYSEYDKSLEKLNKKLNPDDSRFKSEQIVAQLLREILSQEKYQSVMFHSQIALKQLVSIENVNFTERELSYMRHRASCDFVLYYKIGKKPLAVIEVDGGYHMQKKQIERDNLKNSILLKSGLQLLRLRTIESDIKGKIEDILTTVID